MTLEELLQTHPSTVRDAEAFAGCVEACLVCAESCTTCADACLGEESVAELTRCIRLDLDCADICETTARMLSRQTHQQPELLGAIVQTCFEVCRACAEECERHADHHEHCRLCAEECRRCQKACEDLLTLLAV
jgi:hypothetical protein